MSILLLRTKNYGGLTKSTSKVLENIETTKKSEQNPKYPIN